jgi:8-oxo-dGTP pyrophosphatase MutT (NUDIX family)
MPLKDKLFYVAAKAFIKNPQDKVLLLKAGISPHRVIKEVYWDLPGGRIQSGQDILQALTQEIEEETGIQNCKVLRLRATAISNHISQIDGREVGLLLIVYDVSIPENSVVVLSEEHVQYEWVKLNEARRRLRHKYPDDFTSIAVN